MRVHRLLNARRAGAPHQRRRGSLRGGVPADRSRILSSDRWARRAATRTASRARDARDATSTAGFATADFAHGDEIEGEGVGDDAVSWGFDGARNKLWHGGEGRPWEGAWEQGVVIGFAANIVSGQIAVSEGGRWTGGAAGVKFTSDAVRAGVYPAITARESGL